jgi:DNA helicase II / ATP-dependent DNA helicase PcrA
MTKMNDYTPEQQKAINTIDENLQIIACAGSGKTAVVTERNINILQKKPEIKPENIVGFTFTEKAAGELKDRILSVARDKLGSIIGMSEMYIGTIHGFCKKILDEYAPHYQKFTILDAIQTKIFIDRHYREVGMTKIRKTKDDSVMQAFVDTDKFIQIMNMIRESEIDTDELPENLKEALLMYGETFEKYRYLDFTMIMMKAIDAIENDEKLRETISKKIKYLTVDEYQDVNPIQERLIKLLHNLGANLCVVGDDDQLIYAWRGSEIKNILTFEDRYENLKTIYLVDNFRSTKGVVDLAHKVISNNRKRKPKKMIASGPLKHEEGDILYREFDDEYDEYHFIAKRIQQLYALGVPYREMAVLMRVKKLGSNIIRVFNEYEIPFVVEGVNDLFTAPEIDASVSIFNYLNCFNAKSRIKSKTTKNDLVMAWKTVGYEVNDDNLERAIQALEKWKPADYRFYHEFILQKIYQEFLDHLELKEPEGEKIEKLENIYYNLGKFSQVIHDFEVIHFRTAPENKLKNFCSFLQYTAAGYYPEGHLQNPHINRNGVRVMTIHQSKGLQFIATFVPGLCKNIFPQRNKGGLQAWHFLPEFVVEQLERYKRNDVEDERRLFYVSVTRAKKFLYLTRAIYADIYKGQNKTRSTFLDESCRSDYIFGDDAEIPKDYENREKINDLEEVNVPITLTFSHLKDYYGCAYRFKLSFLYGFIQPIEPNMGYGKSLHNAVAEINRRSRDQEKLSHQQVEEIINRHLHLPYANKLMEDNMRIGATRTIHKYVDVNAEEFEHIEYVEQDIEFDLGNGVHVSGRMDLVKRKDLDGTVKKSIVDYKTELRSQSEEITQEQLSFYAIGFSELTGEQADYLERYNLDTNTPERVKVRPDRLEKTKEVIHNAAKEIRENRLEKKCEKDKCKICYLNYLCLTNQQKEAFEVSDKRKNVVR